MLVKGEHCLQSLQWISIIFSVTFPVIIPGMYFRSFLILLHKFRYEECLAILDIRVLDTQFTSPPLWPPGSGFWAPIKATKRNSEQSQWTGEVGDQGWARAH